MRLGDQGVLSLEQWLAQEAAADRDAAAGEGREGEDAADVPAGGESGSGVRTGKFRVGVDPWLVSTGTARSLASKLAESGGCLVPIIG